MGLTSFKGKKPTKQEISVAKNYLSEEELAVLNRLVSAYLDIAEINAMQRKSMYMKEWLEVLDGFMKMTRQEVLINAGKISAEIAQHRALAEYETYRKKSEEELSEVEKQFIASIEKVNRKLKALKNKN
jgi:hypothetical protein